MTTLRKVLPFTLLCAALSGLPLAAQTPDCSFTYTFTGNATQTAVSNLSGNTPCVNWRVTLSTTGSQSATVTFQTSPDNSTWTAVPNTVCSSTVQPPCILQGANPIVGTQGMMYTASYGAYVRIVVTSSSGTGTGTVRAYGAKGASAQALPAGGGGGSMTWPSTPGVTACTGTPCTAWASSYTVGAGANDLVQLNNSGYLPALNASLLTNLPLQPGGIDCPDASGSTTTYTCPTPSPVPGGYASGQLVAFNPQTTNTTTTPTLNVATLGPKNLVDATGGAATLTIGQLIGGSTYLFEYDGAALRLAGGGSGGGGSGTVTHTGFLTSNAVILGNGTADVKPGDTLPADASKFYNGAGHFTTPPTASAVPAASQLTPVTVSANTTGDQTLQEISLTAGILNTVNAANLIHGSGILTIAALQTPTLTFKAKLCTVSGCGSGTVLTLAAITSGASIAASNNGWNLQLMVGTVTSGAAGTLSVHGAPGLTVDIGALPGSAASLYTDTNTTVTAGIDLTAALFVDFTVATSAGNAGNSFTQSIAESLPWAGAGASSGFLHYRSLTIDHTLCGSSNSTNFPVLVSLSNTTFKTVANGGHVQNSSGYDIIFAADSGAATKYPWEVEFYDPVNGVLIAWVQVPTVSHTVDTVFYVLYDNASISTAQNTAGLAPANVWDSNYVGVWHLPNGSTLTANDSTSNAINGTLTNTPTATAGQVDGAAAFVTASDQNINLGSGSALQLTGALTIEAWVSTAGVSGKRVFSNTSNPGVAGYEIYGDNGDYLYLQINAYRVASVSISTVNATHAVATYNGTTTGIFYINGVAGTPDAGFTSLSAGSTAMIGALPTTTGNTWPGWIDEVRLSKIARGADWILTEYNNQFAPGNIGAANFITYGAEI